MSIVNNITDKIVQGMLKDIKVNGFIYVRNQHTVKDLLKANPKLTSSYNKNEGVYVVRHK